MWRLSGLSARDYDILRVSFSIKEDSWYFYIGRFIDFSKMLPKSKKYKQVYFVRQKVFSSNIGVKNYKKEK